MYDWIFRVMGDVHMYFIFIHIGNTIKANGQADISP